MSAVEKFPLLLSEAEEESSAVAPCFSHEGINVRFALSLAGREACVSAPRLFPDCALDPGHALPGLGASADSVVPLYPTQQPLRPCVDQAEYQCDGDPPLPPQDRGGVYGILQGAGGGKYPG